jgi:hypothetical protein
MTGVMGVLEQWGRSAEPLGGSELAAAVQGCSAAERDALLAGDREAVAVLIGARTSLVCTIAAPDDEPMSDEPVQPADNPDDTETQAA